MDKTLKAEVEKVFAPDGCLAHVTEGYTPDNRKSNSLRPLQIRWKKKQSLVVEAGTGTGKTFAYLVPCIIHGGKSADFYGRKNASGPAFEKRRSSRADSPRRGGQNCRF